MFQGSIVALVTPMQSDGTIDKKALYQLLEWHIASKTDALVVAGTTGEAATLTPDEHTELISCVVKYVAKRLPVIAGTGSASTQHAIELTGKAQKAGADAVLLVTPYYNKPTQQGLFEHYKTIANSTALPLILYNVPSRTACDLLPETIEPLLTFSNIIGIKDATGNTERLQQLLHLSDKNFAVYSGDDATAMDWMLLGAKGVISVTANIAPCQMHSLCEAALAQQREEAEKINQHLMLLHRALFLESNPIPTKWALSHMGMITSGIRLPLTTLHKKFHAALKEAIDQTVPAEIAQQYRLCET